MQIHNWIIRQFFHHRTLSGYLEPVLQTFLPAWRSSAYRARVKAIQALSQGAIELWLEVDKRWPIHDAGQHVELTIEFNGRLLTRVFTIASSPSLAKTKRTLRFVIKPNQQGLFTSKLMQLTPGQRVNISAPKGSFVLDSSAPKVLMLAAGSGITPYVAMLEHLKQGTDQQITLLYFAKPEQHLLSAELIELAADLPNLVVKFMNRAEDGDVAHCLAALPDDIAEFDLMVCGPAAFYASVSAFAKSISQSIKSEHFLALPIADTEQQSLFVSLNKMRLKLTNTNTLLPQLLAKKVPVNFGCGVGICHQCQCLKKKGIVKNSKTGKLSDIGQEWIQLCVSQPVTDVELDV